MFTGQHTPPQFFPLLFTAAYSLQKGNLDAEVNHVEKYTGRSTAEPDGEEQWVYHAKPRATNQWRLEQVQITRTRRRPCKGDTLVARPVFAINTFLL